MDNTEIGPDGLPRLGAFTTIQKIKLQASIEAAWLAMDDERRYDLRVQGILAGEPFVRMRREGEAVWLHYAGEDFGVVEAVWLWDDSVTDMPKAESIPLDPPDAIPPPEWTQEILD
jgi:hypothetical protein